MDVCCVLPVSFYIQAALTTFPILADRGITERCNSLPKFLNFHSFFWRIGQKVAWRLILCALAPRSEKSSLRHCNWLGNNFICQCYTKDRSENTSDYRSPHFAGQEPNWMFNLYRVEFASSDPANHVDVTFVPSEGPIRFQRIYSSRMHQILDLMSAENFLNEDPTSPQNVKRKPIFYIGKKSYVEYVISLFKFSIIVWPDTKEGNVKDISICGTLRIVKNERITSMTTWISIFPNHPRTSPNHGFQGNETRKRIN